MKMANSFKAGKLIVSLLTASGVTCSAFLSQLAMAAPLSFDCFDRRTGQLVLKSVMDVSNENIGCEYAGGRSVDYVPVAETYPVYRRAPGGVVGSHHRRVSDGSGGASFLGGMMGGILGGAIGGSIRK